VVRGAAVNGLPTSNPGISLHPTGFAACIAWDAGYLGDIPMCSA
jgi:hypothetical protein